MLDWRAVPEDIEAQVRDVLERSGELEGELWADPHRVTEACKAWVRRLIRVYVPHWQPGDALAWSDAWRIGEAFERVVASPRPAMPDRRRKRRRAA